MPPCTSGPSRRAPRPAASRRRTTRPPARRRRRRGDGLAGLRHPRAADLRPPDAAPVRGRRGVEVGGRVELADQGQAPAVAVAEPGHLVRSVAGIPAEYEGVGGEPDQQEAEQPAHELGRGLVGAALGAVELGRPVQVDQHRQCPPPGGARELHQDGEDDPPMAVPPGGVRVGRADGVAVPGLAVHRPPGVAVHRVVADQRHRPAGTRRSRTNRVRAHPRASPDHGARERTRR